MTYIRHSTSCRAARVQTDESIGRIHESGHYAFHLRRSCRPDNGKRPNRQSPCGRVSPCKSCPNRIVCTPCHHHRSPHTHPKRRPSNVGYWPTSTCWGHKQNQLNSSNKSFIYQINYNKLYGFNK